MKKGLILTIIILAVAAAGAAYFYYQQSMQTSMGQMPAPTVEVATVEKTTIPVRIDALGTLVANADVPISPEVAGQVARIDFKSGDAVTKGTPLIELDDKISSAELKSAQAQLRLAEVNYKRMATLSKRHLQSQQVLDQALANLRDKQAQVEVRKAQLEKMSLLAPFDGVLGIRKVSVGDYVIVGQSLVNLIDTRHLKVDYHVPEHYLSQLKIGQPLVIRSNDLEAQKFQGIVTFISPIVDPTTRSVEIQATMQNDDGLLSPGMFVSVEQTLGADVDALVIPQECLVPTIAGDIVYKVVNNKVIATNVQVGTRTDEVVQILKGVVAGDVIVSAGQQKLKDGMAVKIIVDNKPGGGKDHCQ